MTIKDVPNSSDSFFLPVLIICYFTDSESQDVEKHSLCISEYFEAKRVLTMYLWISIIT